MSEVVHGDPPMEPQGCIAQAWGVVEALRAWSLVDEFKRTYPQR